MVHIPTNLKSLLLRLSDHRHNSVLCVLTKSHHWSILCPKVLNIVCGPYCYAVCPNYKLKFRLCVERYCTLSTSADRACVTWHYNVSQQPCGSIVRLNERLCVPAERLQSNIYEVCMSVCKSLASCRPKTQVVTQEGLHTWLLVLFTV